MSERRGSRLPHCFASIQIPTLTVGGTYRGDRTGLGAMLARDKLCHPALLGDSKVRWLVHWWWVKLCQISDIARWYQHHVCLPQELRQRSTRQGASCWLSKVVESERGGVSWLDSWDRSAPPPLQALVLTHSVNIHFPVKLGPREPEKQMQWPLPVMCWWTHQMWGEVDLIGRLWQSV